MLYKSPSFRKEVLEIKIENNKDLKTKEKKKKEDLDISKEDSEIKRSEDLKTEEKNTSEENNKDLNISGNKIDLQNINKTLLYSNYLKQIQQNLERAKKKQKK
jgi:hypothetical protein